MNCQKVPVSHCYQKESPNLRHRVVVQYSSQSK
jgi:hypothetical protein